MVIKHKLVIQTPTLFGSKIEEFKGFWESEVEVRRVLAKYRPKSKVLKIERIYPDNEVLFDEYKGDKP